MITALYRSYRPPCFPKISASKKQNIGQPLVSNQTHFGGIFLKSDQHIFVIFPDKDWMNEWCIYIALLLCIAIHPKRFTIMWGGGLSSTTTSVQHPLGWCDGSHSTTAPERSPHTSYRWRGERDRANQVDGDY